jgi:hypothetical protein
MKVRGAVGRCCCGGDGGGGGPTGICGSSGLPLSVTEAGIVVSSSLSNLAFWSDSVAPTLSSWTKLRLEFDLVNFGENAGIGVNNYGLGITLALQTGGGSTGGGATADEINQASRPQDAAGTADETIKHTSAHIPTGVFGSSTYSRGSLIAKGSTYLLEIERNTTDQLTSDLTFRTYKDSVLQLSSTMPGTRPDMDMKFICGGSASVVNTGPVSPGTRFVSLANLTLEFVQ